MDADDEKKFDGVITTRELIRSFVCQEGAFEEVQESRHLKKKKGGR